MRNTFFLGSLASVLLLAVCHVVCGSAWTVTQITNNSYDDQGPTISGNNIAWQARGDIFLYDGSTTQKISDSSRVNAAPQISGSNVVWWAGLPGQNGDRSTDEIFFYDGTTAKRLTNNSFADLHPQVSGPYATWWSVEPDSYGVYFYDGLETTRLSSTADAGTRPRISGPKVVWSESDGHDPEVFLFDGIEVRQLTNNDHADVSPVIDGDNIAWRSDSAIWYYDGDSSREIVRGIGINLLSISAQNIAWSELASPGRDEEVFLYDGASVTRLTNNDLRDFTSDISGTNVVWSTGVLDESEIFVYDGKRITQLTNNPYEDNRPLVSGDNIVWWGGDGHDEEIYLATLKPSDFDNLGSLQRVFDGFTVAPVPGRSSVDVTSDFINDGDDSTWTVTGGAIATFSLVAELGDAEASFGVYDVTNPKSRLQVFSGPDSVGAKAVLSIGDDGWVQVYRFGDGISVVAGTNVFMSSRFGFYLDSPRNGIFYGDTRLNADNTDHLLAYQGHQCRYDPAARFGARGVDRRRICSGLGGSARRRRPRLRGLRRLCGRTTERTGT